MSFVSAQLVAYNSPKYLQFLLALELYDARHGFEKGGAQTQEHSGVRIVHTIL